MKTELIIRSNSSDIDFALLKDGKLVELHNETLDNNFSVGDIFLSKVKKTLTNRSVTQMETTINTDLIVTVVNEILDLDSDPQATMIQHGLNAAEQNAAWNELE